MREEIIGVLALFYNRRGSVLAGWGLVEQSTWKKSKNQWMFVCE
jgi:hypothetical protein